MRFFVISNSNPPHAEVLFAEKPLSTQIIFLPFALTRSSLSLKGERKNESFAKASIRV